MEKLKEKIFQFGIYGAKLEKLTKDEIEMAIEEPWVEIIQTDTVEKLKRHFTTDCLRVETNRSMVESYDWSDLYVRMGTLAWKDYLTAGTFNFTSKEYFLIMNLLIETKGYVDNVELRKLCLDPKKTHYCINRLAKKGFIEYRTSDEAEKKSFIYKVRVIIDEKGFVTRCVGRQPADPSRAGSCGKFRMFEYRIDIGLYDNIRSMILSSERGIITEDLKNKLGVSSKIGYKLLNKVFNEEKEVFKRVKEFEGRVRRYRYHAASRRAFPAAERGEKGVGYITSEERVMAIKKLMSMSPILQLDKRTYEKLQEITGWRYEFDRRTIIKAAILAGFKIYKQKRGREGKCSRYMIMRNEMVESDVKALEMSNCDSQENMSEFQRKIYSIFVNSPKLVEMDNGYVPLREERLKLLYKFLIEKMSSKEVESLRFDWEVIGEMEFDLLLSIIPFSRIGLKESLCRFIDSGEANTDAFKIRNYTLHGEIEEPHCSSSVGKTVAEVINMELPQSIKKLIRLKVGIGNFASLFRQLNDLRVLDISISSEKVVVKKTDMDLSSGIKALEKAKRAKGGGKYICLSRRIEFFKKVCNVEEKGFYDEAYKVIYTEFKGDEFEAMFDRLKMFRDEEVDDQKQSTFERLYMGFKKNIIELGWLGTLDFNSYSVSEAKRALKALSRDKIIANYKGIKKVEFVTPHESFLRVINKKYDVFRFKGYHEHKGMGYFSHYFDLVYYTLATSGSLEINELISRIRFIANFEMEMFLSEYKKVFKVSNLNNTRIVSLGIFMDPFE
ncbi:HTH domain-containing protein [Encephalitozoon hellem]|nr:HTH domain-containing protein [Encephalitozoon hellem]